jgi:hypothetical protein
MIEPTAGLTQPGRDRHEIETRGLPLTDNARLGGER